MGIHQAFWFGDTSRNVGVALVGASVTAVAAGQVRADIGIVLESRCDYAEMFYGHMLSYPNVVTNVVLAGSGATVTAGP